MKIVAFNKKASFNYFLEDKYECGIALLGSEVKSLRDGKCSLTEAYVSIMDGEVFLKNCEIANWKNIATGYKVDPKRARKLLLNKSEIIKIKRGMQVAGYTVIPTKVYFNAKGKIKVEIALGKGKHLYDKKEKLKEDAIKKDTSRAVKSFKTYQ